LGHHGKGKPLVLPRLEPQCRGIWWGRKKGNVKGEYTYGGGEGREWHLMDRNPERGITFEMSVKKYS